MSYAVTGREAERQRGTSQYRTIHAIGLLWFNANVYMAMKQHCIGGI